MSKYKCAQLQKLQDTNTEKEGRISVSYKIGIRQEGNTKQTKKNIMPFVV